MTLLSAGKCLLANCWGLLLMAAVCFRLRGNKLSTAQACYNQTRRSNSHNPQMYTTATMTTLCSANLRSANLRMQIASCQHAQYKHQQLRPLRSHTLLSEPSPTPTTSWPGMSWIYACTVTALSAPPAATAECLATGS